MLPPELELERGGGREGSGLGCGRGSGDGVTRIKDPFVHHIVIDGRLAGSWTRTVKGGAVTVECAMYSRPNADVARAIDTAASRLGQFLKLPATSSWAGRR